MKKTDDEVKKDDYLKEATLEEYDGFDVLYIHGTHYEMGFQYGKLLKKKFFQNRRAWLDFCYKKSKIKHKDLLQTWKKISKFIPQEYIEEIKGRADALNLAFEELGILEAISLVVMRKEACCGIAAWGPATSNGDLYHFRSQDLPLTDAIDPVTSKPAYENQLIVIRNPDSGFASVFPESPCSLGIEGGFNEKSICLGWMEALSKDQTSHGIPIGIRELMALDQTSNLKEAIYTVNSNKTLGCNLIISNGKKPEAVAVEQSPNYDYISTWDDSLESRNKCWNIDHVVRRTNFFISPSLANTQKDPFYNQDSLLWPFLPLFRHYIAVSRGIEKNWGKLNQNILDIIRSVYRGRTDVFYAVCNNIIKKRESFNQWISSPKTGDIWFSFAKDGKNAYESPVYHINLFHFLNLIQK
ncbi:MAG: C45 family autoproteolytic acyltransferase/hydrolase [Candidatus Thermoplasmatota archaeon]